MVHWRALAVLVAALTLQVAAGQASSGGESISVFTGKVTVLSKSYPKGQPGTREVYLRADTAAGANTAARRRAFKLEGSTAARLLTGQRVSVSGRLLSGLGDPTERLVVASVSTLEEPQYRRRRAVQEITRVQAGISLPRAGRSGSTAPGGRRRLEQQQQQQQPGGSSSRAQPTVPLPVEAPAVSTLVLPISFAGCPGHAKPWWTKQDVESVFFEGSSGAQGDPTASVGGLFRICSQGQSLLTPANSHVADVITLPCDGVSSLGTAYTSDGCTFQDFLGWQEAAVDAVAAARNVTPGDYLYKQVVVPPHTSCPWAGMGFIGCDFRTFDCASWVMGQYLLGADRAHPGGAQASLHELGHNLFLDHATGSLPDGAIHQYGDSSCSMGFCCAPRCFNTPHSWQLGWLAPQALDGSTLAPAQTVNVTILAQGRDKFSGLQINASTWLSNAPTTLYVSYRLAEGGDAQLGAKFVDRVSVHNFTSTDNHTPRFSYELGVLAAGQALAEPLSGLVVRVRSTSPGAGTATLSICRKVAGGSETRETCMAAVDGDCDELVGTQDPDCALYLPGMTQPLQPPPGQNTSIPGNATAKPGPAVPANAAKMCPLGHAFCGDVAKFAQQAKPKTNFFTRDATSGKMMSLCRYWLARPTCAGSLVPCGCGATATAQGSAVKPPPSKPVKPAQRCAMGHATCAAAKPGSTCQYWAAPHGKQPMCSGSRITCSCTTVRSVKVSLRS